MKRTVLVTGGAGFIGSHLCRFLLGKGFKVTCVDNMLTNSSSEIVLRPPPVDDPKTRCPDISKAKKLLNWQPKVSVDDGLRKTIGWFKKSA